MRPSIARHEPRPGPAGAVLYHRYALLLDALESVLTATGLAITQKTTVPEQALARLMDGRADLLIAALDTAPGSIEGLELVRRAAAPPCSAHVIALRGETASFSVEEVLAAGASALIDTAASGEDVAFAVHQTYDPSIHLPRRPARAALHEVEGEVGSEALGVLTARELQILRLAAEGYSNGEVADRLRITGQTVKFHLSNVYRKLGVANRTQATRQAQRLRLLAG